MTRTPLSAAILGLLLALPGFGCSHSQPISTGVDAVTVPFSTAPPVRLTYNAADMADTTFPFQRRALLQLGVRISGQFVNWLRDTHWTGSSSFVSLAQFDKLTPHPPGALIDSVFIGLGVLRGERAATGATFTIVPGTEGAQMYSLAENGAWLIFVRSGAAIERVPAGAGSPTTVATLPVAAATGLTCQGSICLATTGRPGMPESIYRVMLATGEAIPLAISISDSPSLPPTGGTIVGRNGRTLYLFSGLLP